MACQDHTGCGLAPLGTLTNDLLIISLVLQPFPLPSDPSTNLKLPTSVELAPPAFLPLDTHITWCNLQPTLPGHAWPQVLTCQCPTTVPSMRAHCIKGVIGRSNVLSGRLQEVIRGRDLCSIPQTLPVHQVLSRLSQVVRAQIQGSDADIGVIVLHSAGQLCSGCPIRTTCLSGSLSID